MTSIFNTNPEYPKMHAWCKFGDSSSKSVTSYRADKEKFTDRQMDRQTDRRRQRQYPFGLKGQGVKIDGTYWFCLVAETGGGGGGGGGGGYMLLWANGTF